MNTEFRKLTKKESDKAIISIIEELLKPELSTAGKHRREQWDKGWQQNVEEQNIIPHYFGKHKINRRGGVFVEGVSPRYEINMLYTILDIYFNKYLKHIPYIYEFGCGTGHNLGRLSRINRKAILYGLDWADSSKENVYRLGFAFRKFDFFNPNTSLKLNQPCGIYTVAALEQTGTNYKKFINYLLKEKPQICLHIEPIEELLDPQNNLLDYLSVKYFHKRKYLSGFLTHLKQLQKEKKIKIHEAKRNHIGSLFIEGYSVIAWSPL